jgi:SAM-dependent methyltransferase
VELDFKDNSFDAVIMIELIEHLLEKTSLKILKKAERWARKKVIVSSPNGFLRQGETDGNPWQKHLSGWSLERMRSLGYQCRGLAGLKLLRQENQSDTMSGEDLMSSVKYRPRFFWFAIATLSQVVTYRVPRLAFELFSVKKVFKDPEKLYPQDYYNSLEYGFRNENRADHNRLLQLIDFKEGTRVLEIGCGFGILLSKIPSKRKVGIEINDTAVSKCLKKGLEVILYGEVEKKIPFADSSFDIVIMNEVIEHLKNPERVVRECHRVLGDAGVLAITTPNRSFLLKVYREPTHFSEMTIRQVRNLLVKNGFVVTTHEVSGFSFLLPLLEWFVFLPGRTLKKLISGKKRSIVDSIHKAADTSVLKIISTFRDWGLSCGVVQLIIARKKGD